MATKTILDAYGSPHVVADAPAIPATPKPERGNYAARRGKTFPPAPGCWGKTFNGDNQQWDPASGARVLDEAKGD